MTFIDATFLPFLLLIVLATHLVRSKGTAIWVLILGSLFFYGCRHGEFLLLLIFVSFFDFALSRVLIRTQRLRTRKWILGISLVSNLGLLCFLSTPTLRLEISTFFANGLGWLPGHYSP